MEFFKKVISYNGEKCDVCHVDTKHFNDIPDKLKLKAHAVCFWNSKILLVSHSEWKIWSIPGGTREQGESIEETLVREIVEETNCEVLDYAPIAYQKIIGRNDEHFRLLYKCNVNPIGEFEKDVAGNVDRITWINPRDYDTYIEDKEFRKRIIQRAIKFVG